MLKIPAVYDKDIALAKLTDISHQFLPASLLGISAGMARGLWWMDQE
jgi:hypothetical protein